MNIYLLSQNKATGWDSFDSCIVAAETEDQAIMIHPDGRDTWDGSNESFDEWCSYKHVNIKLIGTTLPDIISGVILSSYNAG